MSRNHRKYRDVLERRRQFLLGRIANTRAEGGRADHDCCEVRALEFALECIDLCEDQHLLTKMTGKTHLGGVLPKPPEFDGN